jgi:predicted esterase
VPGRDQRRFDAHLGFVVDRVIPWATEQLGATATPWTAAGFSNGGDWAIAAAQCRPGVFTRVAAFSVGVVPDKVSERARAAGVRHYLAAGTLEPGFRRVTHQWAQHLQRAGLGCRYRDATQSRQGPVAAACSGRGLSLWHARNRAVRRASVAGCISAAIDRNPRQRSLAI